jgi:hypothetical protein
MVLAAALAGSATAQKGGGGRGGARGGGRAPRVTPDRPAPRGDRLQKPQAAKGEPAKPQRHRDRDGDGRPDRHRPRRGFMRYPWWFYGGYYGSPLWYRSPFYDPFYDPFYRGGFPGGEHQEKEEKGSENVVVDVQPKNASVYVNGIQYSSKGKTRFSLPAGPWKVELRAPGYVTQTIDLNVEPGIRYSIDRKLEKDASSGGRQDGVP